MTPRQKRFVEEYLIDLNATQAAIRAGYSKNSAQEQGYQLVRKTSVKAAIDAAMAERSERTGITQDYVLGTIKEAIERCRQAVPVLNKKGEPIFVETPNGQLQPAYQFEAFAVLKGAELLGKHSGLFTDRVEHSGKNGGPIETVTQFVLAPFVAEGAAQP